MDFADTQYARNFFEGQMPRLIKALERIAEGREANPPVPPTKDAPVAKPVPEQSSAADAVKIFVCYEENSVSLYADAGNVNKMFVTSDAELAKEWVRRSVKNAEANGYLPIAESDVNDLMNQIGEQYASTWVYRNHDENARENYGICVDSFLLSQSIVLLDQLFA